MKKMKKRILLVTEDTMDVKSGSFSWDIDLVQPGEPAIEVVQHQWFDLVLLDKRIDPLMSRKLKALLPVLMGETQIHEIENLEAKELESVVTQGFEEQKRQRMKQLMILDAVNG